MIDWELLGIEPTTDIKIIKRAYVKKLKIHHPEEDPEGYQRLRETYDEAKKYAKQRKKSRLNLVGGYEDNNEPVATSNEDNKAYASHLFHLEEQEQEVGTDTADTQQIEKFMEEITTLYNDFHSRIDLSNWELLLHKDIVWNFNLQDTIRLRVTNFLQTNNQLPRAIWHYLNNFFNWHEWAEAFYTEHIQEHSCLRFDFIKDAEGIDFETFLINRNIVFQGLKDNEIDKVQEPLEKAYAIYPYDPDLLRLQGEYHRRIGEYDQALLAYSECIAVDPDGLESYIQRARLLFDTDQIEESIEQCHEILVKTDDHPAILNLLGKCYIKERQFDKAGDYFRRILNNQPQDIEAIAYLTRINGIRRSQKKDRRTKRQIRKQINNFSLRERVSLLWRFLPKKLMILYILVGIVLHSFLHTAFVDQTGFTPIGFVKNKIDPIQFTEVRDADELYLVDEENNKVVLDLEDGEHTGLYETESRNEQGELMDGFFDITEAVNPESLTERSSKLVWIGHLGDTRILFLKKYESEEDTSSTIDREIVGEWKPLSYQDQKAIDNLVPPWETTGDYDEIIDDIMWMQQKL